MRLFIAIDLSAGAKREIEKLLKKLVRKHWLVRWETSEKVHITLAFLGNLEKYDDLAGKIKNEKLKIKKNDSFRIDNAKLKIDELIEIIKTSSQEIKPFVISFKGLGCFPDYVFPRVIWLGLKGDLKSLAALQKNLQQKLEAAGFTFDKRPFMPHLTLGRIKKDCHRAQRQEIGRQLKALQKIDFQSEWLVDRIILYQSRLSPKGSVYKKLAEVKLSSKTFL